MRRKKMDKVGELFNKYIVFDTFEKFKEDEAIANKYLYKTIDFLGNNNKGNSSWGWLYNILSRFYRRYSTAAYINQVPENSQVIYYKYKDYYVREYCINPSWCEPRNFLISYNGIILEILVIQAIEEYYKVSLPELYKVADTDKESIEKVILYTRESIAKAFINFEFQGFFLCSHGAGRLPKKIKIRKFKILGIDVIYNKNYYGGTFNVTCDIYDYSTKKQASDNLYYSSNWKLFTSDRELEIYKKLLVEFWRNNYGRDISRFEKQISEHKKRLKSYIYNKKRLELEYIDMEKNFNKFFK